MQLARVAPPLHAVSGEANPLPSHINAVTLLEGAVAQPDEPGKTMAAGIRAGAPVELTL